jgi:hypothetical protein
MIATASAIHWTDVATALAALVGAGTAFVGSVVGGWLVWKYGARPRVDAKGELITDSLGTDWLSVSARISPPGVLPVRLPKDRKVQFCAVEKLPEGLTGESGFQTNSIIEFSGGIIGPGDEEAASGIVRLERISPGVLGWNIMVRTGIGYFGRPVSVPWDTQIYVPARQAQD